MLTDVHWVRLLWIRRTQILMWADERFFFSLSLSVYHKMGTSDTYTLSNMQRLFLQNHLPLFSTGAIANISRPVILHYVDILRCTISSGEHAADVATGELARSRLDEISQHHQQQQHPSTFLHRLVNDDDRAKEIKSNKTNATHWRNLSKAFNLKMTTR